FAPAVEAIRSALGRGDRAEVEHVTQALIDALTGAFEAPRVAVHVWLTRPSSAQGELHGLYTLEPGRPPRIEVWMRTARHRRVVAFRTYLRTVVHELCHHLDFTLLGLPSSFHTRGFFQRESSLVNQLAPTTKRPRRAKLSPDGVEGP
ncbi:MAG TPA: hypothetical protein VE549_10950, partial [Myxococcaceae bacterium]|nr:hypothetical protein [Myxococcaceae bacterium]